MQIYFDQTGFDTWLCRPLRGGDALATVRELADGSCEILVPGREARRVPDYGAAQQALIAEFDGVARAVASGDLVFPERPPAATPAPVAAPKRREKRKAWRGGPKKGTKWWWAEHICDYFYRCRLGFDEKDIRGKSPRHQECYDMALEAARHFSEAQGLEQCSYVGKSRDIQSHRGKGKRLLARASALYEELRKADEVEHRADLKARDPELYRTLYGDD